MTDDNDELRQLIHDAASDIRPRGTLEDIRDRTKPKPRPSARRWFLPAAAAAAVVALVIGGAAWVTHDPNSGKGANPLGTPSTSNKAEDISVPVYYAGDTAAGLRLFTEDPTLKICLNPTCRLRAGLGEVLGGNPADPDYRSLWPADAKVDGSATTTDDSTIVVGLTGDLLHRPAGMNQAQAELAVQELFLTAQAAVDLSDRSIEVVLNGTKTSMLLGVPTPTKTFPSVPEDLMAPVQITSPTNGEKTKAGDLEVSGLASTFEANVVWEVLNRSGAVVKHGFTTAVECCTLSPYSFNVALQPGTYTIVVHDSDASGAGGPVNRDTKEITVE